MDHVYVLGTNHMSIRSAKSIVTSVKKHKIGLILMEGICLDDIINKKMFRKDPFLVYSAWLWSKLLLISDHEATVSRISRRRKVAVHNIDMSKRSLLRLHRWYNPLVFLGLLATCLYFFWSNFGVIELLGVVVIPPLLYMLYFALLTKSRRDNIFTRKAKVLAKKTEENVLLVCGYAHAITVHKRLGARLLN
jgi:hypothetical protein